MWGGGNFAKFGVPKSGFGRNGSIFTVFSLLARRRRIFLHFYTSLMNFLIIFHRFETDFEDQLGGGQLF